MVSRRLTSSLIVLVMVVTSVWAVPPKVIETIPANGDRNVDPNLCEMRFVFDQDMNHGGFSICGGGPAFPEVVGRPQWIDTRTLIMNVRLKPDHEYSLSVNNARFQNCRNTQGESAVPYPVWFKTQSTGGSAEVKFLTESENVEAIRRLRVSIDQKYSYRDLRGIDWDSLFKQYEPKMKAAKTVDEFAQAAGNLLAHAQDMHIWLQADGRSVYPFRRDIERNYDFTTIETLVPDFKKLSATVYTGTLDEIGYIMIPTWSRRNEKAFEKAYTAMEAFSKAPGIIIDVRPNGGGAEPLAREFAGCFVDKPVLYAKHVYRTNSDSFTQPRERVLKPSKNRPTYRGKVAVLMGQANMSSCEAFLLMMKQVPNCKLFGQTSYGSSGNPKPVDLGNGVTVFLPSWKALLPDGTCFEGKGIEPDVTVKTTAEQLQTTDPVLEAALEWLRKP